MSPLVHGKIYPESERSSLARREFRILLDPTALNGPTLAHLLEIDVLREYLQYLPGPPCRIAFVVPAPNPGAPPSSYTSFTFLGLELVPFSTTVGAEVIEALGPSTDGPLPVLVATALDHDIDIVAGATPPTGFDPNELKSAFGLVLGDWTAVKRSCEVFVRGHDIPWSFGRPAWGYPWTPFYSMTEPDRKLIGLWEAARTLALGPGGFDPKTLETLRSLALNRHAGLCYTRDKLLFYAHHDRLSRRKPTVKSDYAFQAGYHLNHYYLQLSAGLDQICRAVNIIFALGFAGSQVRQHVGVVKKLFLKRLHERAPQLADVFEESQFVAWAKMLRGARNFVAHEGFSMPGELYLTPEAEPTDAELDSEIETSQEWKELAAWLPANLLSAAKSNLRYEARLRRYKKVPERMFKIEMDGEEVLIAPLVNIEWDFESFFAFAHKVADLATAHLHA